MPYVVISGYLRFFSLFCFKFVTNMGNKVLNFRIMI
jgi:hypothetical protein